MCFLPTWVLIGSTTYIFPTVWLYSVECSKITPIVNIRNELN